MSYLQRLALVPLLLAVWLVCPPVFGQSDDSDTPAASVAESDALPPDEVETAQLEETLRARIAALDDMPELSEADRLRASELYLQAIDDLLTRQVHAEQLRTFRRALSAAPLEIAELEERLQALTGPRPPVEPPADLPLRELESELLASQSRLAELRAQINELDNELVQLRARPEQTRAELAAAELHLADLERRASPAPGPEWPAELLTAWRVAHEARGQDLREQIAMLEQKLLSHPVRSRLAQARRDLRLAELGQLEQQVAGLQERVNLRRQLEAAETVLQTEEFTQAIADRPSVVREAAEVNAELGRRLAELATRLEQGVLDNQQMSQALANWEERARSIRQQIEIAGFSDALRPVLRSERQQLPQLRHYREGAEQRRQDTIAARLEQFQVDQRLRQLANLDERLQQLVVQAGLSLEQLEEPYRLELRRLLEDRRQLLDRLSDSYGILVDQLTLLEQSQLRLIDISRSYGDLLDEKLFWIASAAPVNPGWLIETQTRIGWLLQIDQWRDAGLAMIHTLRERPLLLFGALLVWVMLLRYRRTMLRHLEKQAGVIGKVQHDSFGATLEALLITLLLALPWPLLLGVWGGALAAHSEPEQFAYALGIGLAYGVALILFATELLRHLCRRNGVGVAHFRWTEQTSRVLVRNLHWFQPLATVAALLVVMTEVYSEEVYRDTLGRLAFAVGTLAFALFVARVMHPSSGSLGGLLSGRSGMFWRLRMFWYPLLVLVPLLLVGLALIGYHYTALQLQSRLFMTGCLLVAAVVVMYLILRWMTVTRRQLAYAQARAKRAAIRAARAGSDTTPGTAETAPEVQEIEDIDLDALGEQSRALLQLAAVVGLGFGLWLIWADLLPAMTLLNEVTLWQQVVTTETGPELTAITLGGLALAVLLLLLLLSGARNLPGLIEMILLRRMGMESGLRYAVTTITRYLITTIALVWALNIMGIGWSQAQWLVAALGVGLGFGLQEIFANLVSGLILLLERPIRVGDTITIDGRSGTVSRIRIRATTITDWDNMEIIIPNKTFITGTLVNWTLTDPVTRVIIPVRVGLAANLEQVREILLQTAKAHPLTLKEPEALVFLLHLGESSVTFEIRVFVRDIMDRLHITNDLYMRAIRALREEGIEVPFPQRDLHVRTVPRLEPVGTPAAP